MRPVLMIAVMASLSLVGCKKKEPEPAPVAAEQAPAPSPIAWVFGPATFEGDRTGGTGSLSVQYVATNGSDTGLQVAVVGMTIFKGDEKVCTGKTPVSEKAGPGGTVSGKVTFACDYTMLPEGDELTGKAYLEYTVGTEAREERLPTTFAFKR